MLLERSKSGSLVVRLVCVLSSKRIELLKLSLVRVRNLTNELRLAVLKRGSVAGTGGRCSAKRWHFLM